MWRGLDDRMFLAAELCNLGSLLLVLGELERSGALLIESLSILAEMKSGIADWPLTDLGVLACARGRPVQATRLLAGADALRRPTGRGINQVMRRAYDETVALLRGQMGEAAFAAEWREGQRLTLQEAVALAMSDEP